MEPTMHLRWHEWKDYVRHDELLLPIQHRVLQQFWIIGKDESDITMPRDVSPCGLYYGRWKDVPETPR